jgi:hypothetical protein
VTRTAEYFPRRTIGGDDHWLSVATYAGLGYCFKRLHEQPVTEGFQIIDAIDIDEIQRRVLSQYARAIVHMRRQREIRKLGLVFGAAIGRDIGIPDWDTLVKKIAEHPDVKGKSTLSKGGGLDQSVTIRIQRLFEWYRSKAIHTTPQDSSNNHPEDQRLHEKEVIAQWRKIISDCLYGKTPYTGEQIYNDHRTYAILLTSFCTQS